MLSQKVIIDGEWAPSYPVRFRDSSSSFSGIIFGIAGTLASMSLKVDESDNNPGSSVVYRSRQFQLRIPVDFGVQRHFQWLINSYGHERSREVKAKPMEALKRLGHEKLKLEEYESALKYSRLPLLSKPSYLSRANRVRSHPP